VAPSPIAVDVADGLGVAGHDVEIVERKGLGHPDTMCDAMMESVSVALCREYLRVFGAILHHNCDKGLLIAGGAEHALGGGRITAPMRLIFGDRASFGAGAKRVDVPAIAVDAARAWLRSHLPRLDPERHFAYQVELQPGSEELTALFDGKGVLGANDTSAGVGYAPLSETERLVLATERCVNGTEFKRRFPVTGEDVKVMGIRRGSRLDLSLAVPLVDTLVTSEAAYFAIRRAVRDDVLASLRSRLAAIDELSLEVNPLDREGAGLAGMYLTVLGTSAEGADSGQVGRGNRVNGLIAFHRPQSLEATAGKNPVSHVGKIYNVLAHRLAGLIHTRVAGVSEATVWLVSRIGRPIDEPQLAQVGLRLAPGATLSDVAPGARAIVEEELARLPAFCAELAEGKHPVVGPLACD